MLKPCKGILGCRLVGKAKRDAAEHKLLRVLRHQQADKLLSCDWLTFGVERILNYLRRQNSDNPRSMFGGLGVHVFQRLHRFRHIVGRTNTSHPRWNTIRLAKPGRKHQASQPHKTAGAAYVHRPRTREGFQLREQKWLRI